MKKKKNRKIYVNQDIPEQITPLEDKGKKALKLKEQAERMIKLANFDNPYHLQEVVWTLRDCADQALMYIEYLERGK